jgi:serine/threonine protein kinase
MQDWMLRCMTVVVRPFDHFLDYLNRWKKNKETEGNKNRWGDIETGKQMHMDGMRSLVPRTSNGLVRSAHVGLNDMWCACVALTYHLVVFIHSYPFIQNKRGTPYYMAPELFSTDPDAPIVHSYATDFWAFGCVLWVRGSDLHMSHHWVSVGDGWFCTCVWHCGECVLCVCACVHGDVSIPHIDIHLSPCNLRYELLTGRPPFYSKSVQELVQLICHTPHPSNTISHVSQHMQHLIARCLDKSPATRMTWPVGSEIVISRRTIVHV